MKKVVFALLALALTFVGEIQAGGGAVIINNNNNARRMEAAVQVQQTRAFRPFLRRLAPRAALNRDAQFGAPVNRFGKVLGAGAR